MWGGVSPVRSQSGEHRARSYPSSHMDMKRLLAISAVVVLTAVACGDNESTGTTTTTTADVTTTTTSATTSTTSGTTTTATGSDTTMGGDEDQRSPTWFEVTGSAEVSMPQATARFRFEEFSETWTLNVSGETMDGDLHHLAFRFTAGFEPEVGSYEINFEAQPIVATYAPPGAGNSGFYDEEQSGTFEITGNDGTTLSGTFSYEASVDDTGAETVMVEGAFEAELGDAFGPPPTG